MPAATVSAAATVWSSATVFARGDGVVVSCADGAVSDTVATDNNRTAAAPPQPHHRTARKLMYDDPFPTEPPVFKEAQQLKQVPLLSNLDSKQLKLLAFTCEVFDYADQDFLFHSDDASDCVYVILAGEVDIIGADHDGKAVLLATSKANTLIGEMAVLSGAGRTASVQARGAVTALKIPNDRFLELVTGNPQVALHVMQTLSAKLADTSRHAADLQTRIERLEGAA